MDPTSQKKDIEFKSQPEINSPKSNKSDLAKRCLSIFFKSVLISTGDYSPLSVFKTSKEALSPNIESENLKEGYAGVKDKATKSVKKPKFLLKKREKKISLSKSKASKVADITPEATLKSKSANATKLMNNINSVIESGNGSNIKGIFRIQGSESEVRVLLVSLAKNRDHKINDLNINETATALKRTIADLKIIDGPLRESYLKAGSEDNPKTEIEKIEDLKLAFTHLDPQKRKVLKEFCSMCNAIAAVHENSLMTVENLAISPGNMLLTKSDNPLQEISENPQASRSFVLLLHHYKEIL